MRKLLLLALLLYDIVTGNRLNNYDYDDLDTSKRNSFVNDRINLRKKALLKSPDLDQRDWDERRRYEQYYDGIESKPSSFYRKGESENIIGYPYDNQKSNIVDNIERASLQSRYRSSEMNHPNSVTDKEIERKTPYVMNCERPHERYEPCFSGCAAITCDNPRERLRPCYPFCEPGCICVQPYVRDDRTHKCVLPEDCTKGLKGIPDLGEDV